MSIQLFFHICALEELQSAVTLAQGPCPTTTI